jgi:hypothetical protein
VGQEISKKSLGGQVSDEKKMKEKKLKERKYHLTPLHSYIRN